MDTEKTETTTRHYTQLEILTALGLRNHSLTGLTEEITWGINRENNTLTIAITRSTKQKNTSPAYQPADGDSPIHQRGIRHPPVTPVGDA